MEKRVTKGFRTLGSSRLVRQRKQIRQESGLGVEDVARRASLDPCVVAEFERGGMNFPMLTLRAIASAPGVELNPEVRKNRH